MAEDITKANVLLKTDNLLSYFFKTTLSNPGVPVSFFSQTGEKKRPMYLMQQIMAEQYNDDEYCSTNTIGYLQQLLTYILREQSDSIQVYTNFNDQSGIKINIAAVVQYIKQNYNTATLKTTAGYFHYSSSYISKYVRLNTGHSFSQLLQSCKLEVARQLLGTTSLALPEICERVGYESVSHFSRIFKTMYGMPPSRYRQLNYRC